MSFDQKTISHVADLAQIHFAPENEIKFAKELDGIINWINQLSELDITNVEPLVSISDMTQPLRKDEVCVGNLQEELLANAPEALHGFYCVPRVVE